MAKMMIEVGKPTTAVTFTTVPEAKVTVEFPAGGDAVMAHSVAAVDVDVAWPQRR